MKWGKVVLIFQAIITLILGIVFLSQVMTIDAHETAQAENTTNPLQNSLLIELSEIRMRYSAAAYILLFVSLIELLIITRLLT